MNTGRFDWRWIAVIAVVVILANNAHLPWQVVAGAFAASGGYLLYYGWQVWSGTNMRSSGQVKYWRGQRYEVHTPRRGPSLPSWGAIGPAAMYLLLGVVLLLSALAVVLRRIG